VNDGILHLILTSGIATKLVLVVLLGFSVATWAVILNKWSAFRRIQRDDGIFLAAYGQADSLQALRKMDDLPTGHGIGFVFNDGMDKVARHTGHGYSTDWLASLERRLKGTIREEVTNQEQYLGLLATTSNVAPFIGLFGTVWGIITAFREIAAMGSASIAAVAPGVAEALVATGAGLFAAIPAVIAFNYFINRVRNHAAQMESFAVEFVDTLHESSPDLR